MPLPEIWLESPAPPAPWPARAFSAAMTPLRPLRRMLRPLRRKWNEVRAPFAAPTGAAPASVGTTGPHFTISSTRPRFEELDEILTDPAVLHAIEAAPPAALASVSPPTPRIPRGALAFGARERATRARVVDIFPLGLELDLLELRLLHLYDVVDRFIVIESPRGFGGPHKPLFLQRNLARFDRFRDKLVPLVLDADVANRWLSGRRTATDWNAEVAMRDASWEAARRHVGDDGNTIVLWSDLDEFPSRDVVHWLATHEVDLPLRLRAPTLRYRFGLSDPGIIADIVAFSPAATGGIRGASLRHLRGPVLRSRGTVHLTSFLPPLALIAKFAMTTDWEPGIVPFVRNAHAETAGMIASGQWFGRPMTPYDAETDPEGLIPWAARAHRARFARLWDQRS